MECRGDRLGGEHGAHLVGDVVVRVHRTLGAEQEGPRPGLDDAVVGGLRLPGPVGAIATDPHPDELGVVAADAFGGQSHPLGRSRPPVRDQDVGVLEELEQLRHAGFGLQIDRDALLVLVRGLELERRIAIWATEPPVRVTTGWFDLDDLGAEVGQDHPAEGSSDVIGGFDHLDAIQWCHFGTPLVASALYEGGDSGEKLGLISPVDLL